MEFFSDSELTKQIGQPRKLWALALLKELIDNALDACENAGERAPTILVDVEDDSFSVRDNGPGVPPNTIIRSLDYDTRTSDKLYFVSPTRGQQGNALKCLWPAPFVFSAPGKQKKGKRVDVEVSAHGACHRVAVSLDPLAREPVVSHAARPGVVKIGTKFDVHWPGVALTGHKAHDFYNARSLLAAFSAVNPHVTFRFRQMTGSQTATELFLRQDRQWRKWLTSTQTSPHWYTDDSLRSLIAGYVAEERAGGPRRTVREFVSGFYGLSGTGKQKKVVDAANMSGLALSDLVDGEDLPLERVGVLLKALQRESRPVRAHRLGVIGEEVFRHRLEHAYGADPHNLRYKKQLSGDDANDLPFVVEVGFGIHAAERTGEPRRLVVGLNWSPAIDVHLDRLDDLLGEMRIDSDDAVTLIVHLACPRLEYLDRGKSNVALPQAIDKALVKCISHVAEDWKKTKERNIRQSKKQQAEKARKCKRKAPLGIEAAAWRVMEEAYLHASGSKANPANARQIMYAARPLVLTLIGECWKHSNQFTQKYLPKFMRRHPDLTADWDVVYDARGHLSEPHTGRRIELGTLKVREYINCWIGPSVDMSSAHTGDVIQLKQDFETFGPANRYKFVLFVEKEGFDTILRRARISERFDVALMSTKGMSVTAARALIERLSAEGVTVLVLHDFDKSGFSIVHTLSNNTERYSFRTKPNVIDTGLRLSDAKAMGLQSEYVEYKRAKKDPRDQIAKCGATEEEQDFLVSDGGGGKKWSGHRIELNAMTSPQFIEFVERKLREAGAAKVIPDVDVLEHAYRQAEWARYVRDQSAALVEAANEYTRQLPLPEGLSRKVAAILKDNDRLSWDAAVAQLVNNERPSGGHN